LNISKNHIKNKHIFQKFIVIGNLCGIYGYIYVLFYVRILGSKLRSVVLKIKVDMLS